MKRLVVILLTVICVHFGAGTVLACNASGYVFCENDIKIPLAGVTVNVDGIGQTTVTDDKGYYYLSFPDFGTYTGRLGEGLPSDAVFVNPVSNELILDVLSNTENGQKSFDWFISSNLCKKACWLTGGGVKFSPITKTPVAELLDHRSNKPIYSFGGNVNPGCSPVAGEGGQWNLIAHNLKLHFQGTAIQVVRCGNVTGIPEGSESPVTPYNFIEFKGTGILKGISGNKADYGTVSFFARAEDRNEPGNENANTNTGGGIDRLFINVFTNSNDPVGSSLVLVDVDGNAATVDPITITGGNLQLHISSCSNPPTP